MTILQRSTFSGMDANDVRPGSTLTKAKVVDWLKDSAAVYEQITGVKVPDASAISATPHVHDGTNGALVRIPLVQAKVAAQLWRRTSEPGSFADYMPVFEVPAWVPTGVSNVLVGFTTSIRETAESVRVTTLRDAGAGLGTVDQQGPGEGFFARSDQNHPTNWLHVPDRHTHFFYMSVFAGDWNVFRIEAWDGLRDPADENGELQLPDLRSIQDFFVLPLDGPPRVAPLEYKAHLTTGTRWKVASAYKSFDDHLIDVADRMLPSYLLVNQYKNTALLWEVLTGLPVANRSTATFDGHKHKDDAATSLNDSGEEMEHPLGSWGYGTARPPEGDTDPAAYLDADCPDPGSSPRSYGSAWTGRIMAPTILAAETGGTYREIFRHRFRLPAAVAANIAAGTGKIQAAVLFETDSQQPLARLSIGAKDGTSFQTTATGSGATGSGRQLVTVTGIQGQDDEAIQTLKLEAGIASTKSVPTCAILGCALAYVP